MQPITGEYNTFTAPTLPNPSENSTISQELSLFSDHLMQGEDEELKTGDEIMIDTSSMPIKQHKAYVPPNMSKKPTKFTSSSSGTRPSSVDHKMPVSDGT